jgi:hypothetical protein
MGKTAEPLVLSPSSLSMKRIMCKSSRNRSGRVIDPIHVAGFHDAESAESSSRHSMLNPPLKKQRSMLLKSRKMTGFLESPTCSQRHRNKLTGLQKLLQADWLSERQKRRLSFLRALQSESSFVALAWIGSGSA